MDSSRQDGGESKSCRQERCVVESRKEGVVGKIWVSTFDKQTISCRVWFSKQDYFMRSKHRRAYDHHLPHTHETDLQHKTRSNVIVLPCLLVVTQTIDQRQGRFSEAGRRSAGASLGVRLP